MSRIAGLIPRNNKGTPRLDATTITRLLGTKQIVRDGFSLQKTNKHQPNSGQYK